MAINFPSSPAVNGTFTNGGNTWVWTGTTWEILPIDSPSFVGLTVANTISGTVSSIANHNLNGLGDVNTPNPTDGAVLGYNTAQNSWVPLTLSSTFNGGTISNPLTVNNNTASTSTTTGALRITGGVAVGGEINVGSFINARTKGSVHFWDLNNSNYVGFTAATNISTDTVWTLPSSDGTAGQALTTNGTGSLSWTTITGGGGGGASNPPGGSDGGIQYNNNGAFGGDATLFFDEGTQTLSAFELFISSTTTSTSVTTGAIVTDGGIGAAGSIVVGGAANKFTASTASSSTTTGTVVVTGGMGVGGNVYVGGNVNIATSPTNPTHATNKTYVDSKALAFSIAFGV